MEGRSLPGVHRFGAAAVPWTVSWSSEETFTVARCPHAKAMAICQPSSPGVGKPQFSKPHSVRQRECIARALCDLCGRTLKDRTKVSLSHARPQPHGAEGLAILQVEPLLHKECAAESMRHCPSLRRDIARQTLMVRQVLQHRAQFAVMSPEYVESVTGRRLKAIGHAKVELRRWIDRDAAWLESSSMPSAPSLPGAGRAHG